MCIGLCPLLEVHFLELGEFTIGLIMHTLELRPALQTQPRGKLSLITSFLDRTILVYSGIFTFLVDAYPIYAASALAANSFARSSFGGIFPLFGIQSMRALFPLLPVLLHAWLCPSIQSKRAQIKEAKCQHYYIVPPSSG
jgi:hypothetical protein